MTKNILIALLVAAALPILAAEPTDKNARQKMATRSFVVLPTVLEKVSQISAELGPTDEQGVPVQIVSEYSDLKMFFSELGVPWPEGSSVKYVKASGKLLVTNTPENLDKMEEIMGLLNVQPTQIQIEVKFIEYDLADIELLAKNGTVDGEALLALWKKGSGRLLNASTCVTQAGSEACVKGVSEYIYPTEFEASFPEGTNTNTTVQANFCFTMPQNFQTREVGSILVVTPNISPEGNLISLNLAPQLVAPPLWYLYNAACMLDAKGQEHKMTVQQPFFYTQSVTTSITLSNGATVLIGGGMPGKDKDKVAYAFVTARLVDIEGRPFKPKEKTGKENKAQ